MKETLAKMEPQCSCVPCTTAAYGYPGFDHCAACCYGSLISEYDHDCPVEEHREMAVLQWGEKPATPQHREATKEDDREVP